MFVDLEQNLMRYRPPPLALSTARSTFDAPSGIAAGVVEALVPALASSSHVSAHFSTARSTSDAPSGIAAAALGAGLVGRPSSRKQSAAAGRPSPRVWGCRCGTPWVGKLHLRPAVSVQ